MERAGIFCDCCKQSIKYGEKGTYIGYDFLCSNCLAFHKKRRTSYGTTD